MLGWAARWRSRMAGNAQPGIRARATSNGRCRVIRSSTRRLLGLWMGAATLLLLGACASLPTDYPRQPSQAIVDTHDTRLGREIGSLTAEHPGKSGFYPLASGIDAFVARLAVVQAADRGLDVQYYIWHNDTAGRILLEALLQAGDRGVRVRLLLDDLDTAGKDLGIRFVDAHPNIEVRLFNPFASRGNRGIDFLTDLQRVNRRMHNKSLTADNQATIVGGRNVGNEYFGGVSAAAFADLDVLAVGPVVNEVSVSFDTYWNSSWAVPISAFEGEPIPTKADLAASRKALSDDIERARTTPYAEALRKSFLAHEEDLSELGFSLGRALLLYDAPSKAAGTDASGSSRMGPKLKMAFDAAQTELLIISPYFVPGDWLVDYLGQLVHQGVKVRILTNSIAANDVGVVHAGYMRYRHALLKRGVELYEFKSTGEELANDDGGRRWSGSSKASLHAKTFGIDRRALFVGSFNLDPRSAHLNTEMGVLFESPELATQLGEEFDSELDTKAYRLELVTVSAAESRSGFEEHALHWVTRENGKERCYTVEPETHLWQRFMVKLLSPFVIESFL